MRILIELDQTCVSLPEGSNSKMHAALGVSIYSHSTMPATGRLHECEFGAMQQVKIGSSNGEAGGLVQSGHYVLGQYVFPRVEFRWDEVTSFQLATQLREESS